MMASAKPLIVIVPGGFFSPRPYDTVCELLREQGYTVIVPQLTVCGDLSSKTPESSEWKAMARNGVPEDVQHIHSLLIPYLDEGHEAVIVSHSYGSLPATLCVEGQTVSDRAAQGLKGGVRAYLCVAGFAYPVRGKNIFGGDEEPPLMPYQVLEEGILHLNESAKPLFFSDVSPEAQDGVWPHIFRTQSRKSLLLRPDYLTSDMKIPKTYLLCEKDETVSPEFQESSIKTGGFDKVVKISAGHVPFVSQPDKVAEVIGDVATTSAI